MLHEIADRYRRWFDYEKDAHATVMASLGAVAEPLRVRHEYRKAVSLLAHIVAARKLWLCRMGASAEWPDEFFPENLSLTEVAARLERMHAAWTTFLEGLDDAALARAFEYRSTEGDWYRGVVDDILAQMFGHSTYHRGQIALLLRTIGATPAVTDFLFWTRERIPVPQERAKT
jgi:uncharacterized damage-inducible protein DinB